VSLATIAAATLWTGVETWPAPGDVARLAIAGLMMGIGLLAFNAVAASRNVEASVSIPIMDTAMLVVSVVAAVLFFAEPITARKALGLVLLVARKGNSVDAKQFSHPPPSACSCDPAGNSVRAPKSLDCQSFSERSE
jgi:hypothetical protein